eukprot:TRINITY_DN141_c0_g1_i1.p1 TRINITY_DN141_c0_g1~~TRINITY_DN141_c0_g1_i1.p1  ORF type:complete len:182 (-),score=54.70 TRINITY_DN141_c0_g1_i1:81-593(-)
MLFTLVQLICSVSIGFGIGIILGCNLFKQKRTSDFDDELRIESDLDEDTDEDDEELKLVLLVRQDLKMGKGKIAAQVGHAAVGAYKTALKRNPILLQRWRARGEAKVALKVKDEDELFKYYDLAKEAGLNTYKVCDAGRTQIAANTYTVFAIGPAPYSEIDKITGELKLL